MSNTYYLLTDMLNHMKVILNIKIEESIRIALILTNAYLRRGASGRRDCEGYT